MAVRDGSAAARDGTTTTPATGSESVLERHLLSPGFHLILNQRAQSEVSSCDNNTNRAIEASVYQLFDLLGSTHAVSLGSKNSWTALSNPARWSQRAFSLLIPATLVEESLRSQKPMKTSETSPGF